jgi:hypothetical protein
MGWELSILPQRPDIQQKKSTDVDWKEGDVAEWRKVKARIPMMKM